MRHILLIFMFLMTGCGAFKEQTGEFVTEAVVDHIAEKVDQRLERRGLSFDRLKSITDLNNDGKVDLDEVRQTAKLAAGEVAIAQTEKWARDQQAKLDEATRRFVSIDENTTVKSKLADFWNYLLATIGALVTAVISYLTKQVFSAKSDGKRDAAIAKAEARMDALERLTGKDLNQDGMIGRNGDPVVPTPAV